MGISKAVSFGNAAVLDSTDYLEYLADDPTTRIIGLYVESVQEGRRFLELVLRLNRTKPILLWKGAKVLPAPEQWLLIPVRLPGRIYLEGVLRQAAVTRVHSLDEVAGTAMAFLYLPPPRGETSSFLGGAEETAYFMRIFAAAWGSGSRSCWRNPTKNDGSDSGSRIFCAQPRGCLEVLL